MTLYFDLNSYSDSADRDLLKRIPRRLASYYLAFPLAEEGGRVTVVTAHPDNTAALWVLRRLLEADIVPVSSSELAIQEAIARVYAAEAPDTPTIVAWADDPDWIEAVHAVAAMFGRVMGQPVTTIDGALPVDERLHVADGAECSLLVTNASTAAARLQALRRSPAPVLLVRGQAAPVRKMLVVLRGYGSDHQTVSQALPFLAHEGATATVLPLTGSSHWRLDDLLAGYAPVRAHLQSCLNDLARANVDVSLKLRQGEPADQVIAELAANEYDLLVIAAEARGDFVLNVLSRVDAAGVLPNQPILIIKPPVDAPSSLD